MRQSDAKSSKQATESDDMKRASSDTEDTAEGTSEVSHRVKSKRKLKGGHVEEVLGAATEKTIKGEEVATL